MVAIGVSGHRVLADLDRVGDGVAAVVRRLEHAYRPGWTVVSSLAEGGDRLVTHRLLAEPDAHLVAVLPLAPSTYEQDFATNESIEEFRALLSRASEVVQVPAQHSRDAAYEHAGLVMLERCEVLVAIWDGMHAQGQGGTGGLVVEARRRAMPVAWVHAGNRRPGTVEPTSLGDQQGAVSFERFPDV